MQVLVADNLIKQTKDKRMPSNIVAQIYKELAIVVEQAKQGNNTLRKYLNSNNGKEMQGVEGVYKYRLNSGDRILYTWAHNLSYLRHLEEDSFVIFAYAKHDKQGNIPLPKKQPMVVGEEIIQVFNDLEISIEDLEAMGISEVEDILDIFDSDYMISHSFYVVDVNDYEDRDPDILDVYLSDEQNEKIESYMKNPSPLMIIGGAGTGKTIMATHILNSIMLSNEGFEGGYFTQSRELLHKIQSQYEYIATKDKARLGLSHDNKVSFSNLNDLFRKELGLSENNLIRTDGFMQFLQENQEANSLMERNRIAPMDLWTEIRGTIKGGLGKNCSRYAAIDKQDCSVHGKKITTIKKMIEMNLLIWRDKRHFIGVKETTTEFTDKIVRDEYCFLKEYFTGFDTSLSMIDLAEYRDLSEEYSTLEREKREIAYVICNMYQEWLGKELYDENDLARMYLEKHHDKIKYDVLIVDEIQDYTEIQIYVLKQMVKSLDRFIMAGDGHQIVNPTAFSERRMYSLIGANFRKESLQKNFRCQQEIVRVVNGLNTLRNQYVAKDKGSDREEYSSREGEEPVFLSFSENNLRDLVITLMDYPGVAILVPDLENKSLLISLVGVDKYQECPDFIWTVADIKGMEYNYVVCVNMISAFEKNWLSIFEMKGRKQSRYRYYFNLFYVAITRAQKYLCFVEKNTKLQFFDDLEKSTGRKYRCIQAFNKNSLWIDLLPNNVDEWLRQARKYEESGNYTQALENYKRAQADDTIIQRCNMKILYEKKDYKGALKIALVSEDEDFIKMIYENLDRLNDNSEINMLVRAIVDPSVIHSDKYYKNNRISTLIRNVLHDSEEAQRRVATEMIGKLSDDLFFETERLRNIREVL